MKLSIDMLNLKHIRTHQEAYLMSLCMRAIILFNGKRIKNCIYANDERGYIMKYKEPPQVIDDNLVTETLRGKVRIIDPDEEDLIAEGYTRCDRD